ncbi:MAG: glycoside hydrolase family 32 protein [Lachnospiraceae bacterium]
MIDRKELLAAVDEAEKNRILVAQGKYRHKFHIMPPVGWLNDPNGLCYYKGWHHVFFQYSPTDPSGGMKCWGHYRSKDLCTWQYLGVPFLPDQPQDKDGVYSGCAFVDDGKMEIFYTGNTKEKGEFDYITAGRGANVIYCSSEDGIHFSSKEVLLTNADYPKECSNHVRDPKVWKESSIYYMVLGARTLDDQGAILLYESADKKQWSFIRMIRASEKFGYMWECPDMFDLDDLHVLACCPQGVESETLRYQNIYQSGYFLTKEEEMDSGFIEWDMGFDFYAPQTYLNEQGERILIGWAGLPDAPYTNQGSIQEGWQHSLTLPRKLTARNGKIYQNPAEELKNCRIQEIALMDQHLDTQSFDLLIEFEHIDGTLDSDQAKRGFILNEDLKFLFENGNLTLEFLNNTGEGRGIRRAKIQELKSLRILYDVSMLEIYVNEGELVFTSRYYPKQHIDTNITLIGPVTSKQCWEMSFQEYKNVDKIL